VNKMKKHFGGALKNKTVTLWGLAFKPNTDDMRDAPSLTIIEALQREGVKVRAYDPEAMEEAKRRLGKSVKYFENYYDALKGADALVVVTEWNEFRRPNFERMLLLMRTPVIFDGRNIYSPRKLKEMGFEYHGIGC